MAKEKLSIQYLKECLSYDELTGKFTWKARPRHHFSADWSWVNWNKRWAGCEAGWIEKPQNHSSKTPYHKISVNGVNYKAHRLAWVFISGEWPEGLIDHKDGNGLNNAKENLRVVTDAENARNQSRRKDNKSGITGVCWSKQLEKWQAHGRYNDKLHHLGFFETIFDAACVRKSWEIEFDFHENHGRN